jgi:hypothetical protein
MWVVQDVSTAALFKRMKMLDNIVMQIPLLSRNDRNLLERFQSAMVPKTYYWSTQRNGKAADTQRDDFSHGRRTLEFQTTAHRLAPAWKIHSRQIQQIRHDREG